MMLEDVGYIESLPSNSYKHQLLNIKVHVMKEFAISYLCTYCFILETMTKVNYWFFRFYFVLNTFEKGSCFAPLPPTPSPTPTQQKNKQQQTNKTRTHDHTTWFHVTRHGIVSNL